MAFFDIFDNVADAIVGDSGWGGLIGDVVDIGFSAYDAYSTGRSAQKAQEANLQAAQIYAQGQEAQAQAIREANEQARQQYQQQLNRLQPGQDYLAGVIARDPYQLTPQQQLNMDDIRRNTQRSLASSGLRGSGRSQAAALRQVEADARGGMIESNLARTQMAANQLSGQVPQAVGGIAGLDVNTGRVSGGTAANVAGAQADATLANAQLSGQAVGDIASIAAGTIKDKTRRSRYADYEGEETI